MDLREHLDRIRRAIRGNSRRADVPDGQRAFAIEIGNQVAEKVVLGLMASPSIPIRPPSHNCPPVYAVDFDLGIVPQRDYTPAPASSALNYSVLTAGNTTTLLTFRARPDSYVVLFGFSFAAGWDVVSTDDPYAAAQVTLRINGEPHPTYNAFTQQINSSLSHLNVLTMGIPATNPTGTTIEMIVANIGANDLRIAGRLRGWQFPAAAVDQGIGGGLVPG